MWKRTDEAQVSSTKSAMPQSTTRTAPNRDAPRVETPTEHVSGSVKGELTGSENVNINGQVEGTINLPQHLLTFGSQAHS